jgi:hypothetical protein
MVRRVRVEMYFEREDVVEDLRVHTGDDAKSGHESHARQHVPFRLVRLALSLTGKEDFVGDLDTDTEERADGGQSQ